MIGTFHKGSTGFFTILPQNQGRGVRDGVPALEGWRGEVGHRRWGVGGGVCGGLKGGK